MSSPLSNLTPCVARPRTAAVVAGALWHLPGAFRVARLFGSDYGLRCVLFHDVSDTESSFTRGLDITVTRKQFEAALKFIKKHYAPVSLEAILEADDARPLPDRALLLSFDDAYASVAEFAAPLCLQYGVPAVFFVNGNCLDNRQLALDNLICHVANACGMETINAAIRAAHASPTVDSLREVFCRFLPAISLETRAAFRKALAEGARIDDAALAAEAGLYLSSRQLRDLARFNFAVGNHTYSHAHGRVFTAADLAAEIDRNKAELEAASGQKVRSFSVPYGGSRDLTPALAGHLFQSGHEAVFLAEATPNSWSCGPAHDRISLRGTSDAARFSEIEILPRLRAIRDSLLGAQKSNPVLRAGDCKPRPFTHSSASVAEIGSDRSGA